MKKMKNEYQKFKLNLAKRDKDGCKKKEEERKKRKKEMKKMKNKYLEV